ncbi:hypothetical protein PPTG_10091 [Phytophthora nicotianae INRA-310]|uniref:Uncharacterized protein n=1 Tax=Phytophthora nicotianae (strain INRA-310) TaxID=761204 RepID=W2QD31_PHYN3|nr:hypothetical protein PPTG_10091 [Phytophthora nicotianae INRA-310]ETN11098.1 hypothetical protein PPTG_10091 [Phytophthora nicotianae INRA-310]
MENWGISKDYCSRFVRDSGSNMVSTGEIMDVSYHACVSHELHLIVSGLLSKKKTTEQPNPAWEAIVSAETDACLIENEEDDDLSEEDGACIEGLRDAAVDEMDVFLKKALAALEMDELANMRKTVQTFRTLAVYFRKSPKARHRLEEIQRTS